jgi:hypothetical protein
VRPVSRAEALLRLADQAFNYSLLGTVGFQTLADVVDGCTCFDVRYGDLDAALDCVAYVTGDETGLASAV